MSRKESAVRDKLGLGSSSEAPRRESSDDNRSGDFLGNFIYFMVLTVALSFILANNSLDGLFSSTGIVILSILICLDIFPAIQLIKHMLYGREAK